MTPPRNRVAVDAVVFGAASAVASEDAPLRGLEVLLIRRGVAPFEGSWALPGGLVLPNEDLESACRRELLEEADVAPTWLEQLYTFGQPERDPRERVVSVAWLGLVQPDDYPPKAATDAADARWWPVDDLPPLAFDHAHIVAVGLERLRGKVQYKPVGFDLLPDTFTLSELQQLYEVILQRSLDKRNFRRKLLKTGLLVDTGEKRRGGAHRAPRLYRFDRARYAQLEQQGVYFEL